MRRAAVETAARLGKEVVHIKDVKVRETIKDIRAFDYAADLTRHLNRRNVRIREDEEPQKAQTGSFVEDAAGGVSDGMGTAASRSARWASGKGIALLRRAVSRSGEGTQAQDSRYADSGENTDRTDYKTGTASRDQVQKFSDATLHQNFMSGPTSTQKGQHSIRSNRISGNKAGHQLKQIFKDQSEYGKSIKTREEVARHENEFYQENFQATEQANRIRVEAFRKTQKAAHAATRVAKATKRAAKATVKTVKATATAIKGTAALIAAGGWVAVVIIVVICVAAVLFSSCFGVLCTDNAAGPGTIPMSQAVADITKEFDEKLQQIIDNNPHNSVLINNAPGNTYTITDWSDVIAVYSVLESDDSSGLFAVATMDTSKKNRLRQIFWEADTIEFSTVLGHPGVSSDAENSNLAQKILNISVHEKSLQELMNFYRMSGQQRAQIIEVNKWMILQHIVTCL